MSAGADTRILVVGPAWVGDMVMCQSLLMILRASAPEARIDVLAPGWTRPLLDRMPEVDHALVDSASHGRLRPIAQVALSRRLRKTGYGWAVLTRRSMKSALAPLFAGIPRRTGVRGESRYLVVNDVRSIDADSHPAAVSRLAALGLPPGACPAIDEVPWPKLRSDVERGMQRERELGLADRGTVVGLAPGAAFGPAKRWPLEHWIELARRLAERGRAVWVFGGADEAAGGARVTEAAGALGQNLCGRTSLEDVIDLMARCGAVVSNDSGLMHVAAAVGTGVVALFGSTSPKNTPPLTRAAKILWLELECSPCFSRVCPLGHRRCLRDLTVERALEALDQL